MSQTFGMESPQAHPLVPHRKPASYVVVIDSGGYMVARLFTNKREKVSEMDAAVEELGSMIAGLIPVEGATDPEWDVALAGHSEAERADARVYTLAI